MAETTLDQVVKGNVQPAIPKSKVISDSESDSHPPPSDRKSPSTSDHPFTTTTIDPTSLLPSSPPQIYLNLLIIEASLRSQYLALRARRRQNTCVLFWLAIWIAYFTYTQYLRPLEDGTGFGGSPYWLLDMFERIALISGVITGVLFWVTGQWERGIRWPRRWFGTANRGLRGMNCKIVLIKGRWWRELMSQLISVVLPLSWLYPTPGSSYQYIDYSSSEKRHISVSNRLRPTGVSHEYVEEDIAPGGDYIQVMLMAKHFTSEFRENWEIYRTDFWEQENARRRTLRKRVRKRQKEISREEGGWLWWTGWRGWAKTLGFSRPKPLGYDLEQVQLNHSHSALHSQGMRKHARKSSVMGMEKEMRSSHSHSRNSSRSSTATPEIEEPENRRWSVSSTSSTNSTRRRKAPAGAGSDFGSSSSRPGGLSGRPSLRMTGVPSQASSSRPSTPSMVLRSQASSLSNVSFSSDDASDGQGSPGVIKQEEEQAKVKVEPMD